MSDTLYYDKPVLLNRDKHRHRRIRATPGFAFARNANSLFLAGVEFTEACKEYAIVFILQNSTKVEVQFLGAEGWIPLGLALLIAAVGGGVVVAIAGIARITQLRINVRRSRRGGVARG